MAEHVELGSVASAGLWFTGQEDNVRDMLAQINCHIHFINMGL